MIVTNFKKKDAHFWIALAYGATYFLQGFLGIIDFLIPDDFSWRTYGIWPLTILQLQPWTTLICLAGLLLFLDAARKFTNRKVRFVVWVYMMVILWGISSLVIYTSIVLVPHPVGFALTNIAATAAYSLLFLKGPPLIGKGDIRWEDPYANT